MQTDEASFKGCRFRVLIRVYKNYYPKPKYLSFGLHGPSGLRVQVVSILGLRSSGVQDFGLGIEV